VAAREPALRILQVASSLYEWGGIERYVVFLQQGLEARGHHVEIACPPDSPIAQRASHPTVPIEMRRKLDFRGFAAYLRLFRSTRYDVVHAHFSPDFTLPAYAAKMRRQGLTVITRHVAVRWKPAKARTYARIWRHIIPVSHAVERRLLESGIPASQMTVAKAGLPRLQARKPIAQVRSNLGIPPEVFAIGSFGRLVPEKGVDVLIEAMRNMKDARACIFGHGPHEEKLRAIAGDLDSVKFHGQVADVADSMAAMDVIAIPSIWEEAFPYSALEAMALGLPIAASDIGGLPEMVEDGVNGRLFPPSDPAGLARVLSELQSDSRGRVALGKSGQERYEREFTLAKMAERIEAVYLAQIG
jgi:glycosyltransferase involved in cell wall biosynthesis